MNNEVENKESTLNSAETETKTDEVVNEKVDEVSKPQSREENSAFAKMRKQLESLTKENERLKQNQVEVKNRAFDKISDDELSSYGLNRDDLNAIEDEKLIKNIMSAVELQKEKPLTYALSTSMTDDLLTKKEKQAEETKLQEQAKRDYELRIEDIKRAQAKYGTDVVNEYGKADSEFMRKYGNDIPIGAFTTMLGMYLDLTKQTEEKAKDLGTIPTANVGVATDTAVDIDNMTKEQFEEYMRKRGRSYLLH